MEKKPKSHLVKYKENPFLEEFEIKLKTKLIKSGLSDSLVDEKTGELVAYSAIHKIEMHDEEQFIKVFRKHNYMIFELSKRAIKVMEYIFSEAQKYPNQDVIYLSTEGALEYFKKVSKSCGKSTYMLALKEIVERGVLAKKNEVNRYFINPEVFFNGDRAFFLTELRKTRREKLKAIDNRDTNTIDMFEEKSGEKLA